MPDLIRHPASPSPWAERILLAARTRFGWIPDQGRNDGRKCACKRIPASSTMHLARPGRWN